MDNNLSFLSTRKGFNVSLKHFKLVNKFIKSIGQGNNLADLINSALEEKMVDQYQFSPILNALLIDKYNYYSESFNLKSVFNGDLASIADQVKDWDKVDIVLSYFHPQLDQIVINPKDAENWGSIGQLKENELLVVYVGFYNNIIDVELAKKAARAIKSILSNEKVSNVKIFKGAPETVQPKQKQEEKVEEKKKEIKEQKVEKKETIAYNVTNDKPQTTSNVKKKLSPHYGVLVSNELFHNGNVEAWKKIIASYEIKYSDTKVLVFYEGEQIQDINTLFKWGKVKHGTNIYFALLGPEFLDVSKLRRYLAQGASNRFEDFLRGDPTKTLSLF